MNTPGLTPSVDAAVLNRRAQWRGAIEQELQVRIQEAAHIREQINTAKTQTKKVYFTKKFKKVSNNVMQMVAALQKLDSKAAAEVFTSTSPDAIETPTTSPEIVNEPAVDEASITSIPA